MTETQNQKSEIMNIDMHDTPLHKWERELNEAQKRGDEYGQKYAKTMLERDQLKAEVERQANNNKLLLVQQEHEEQTREFLRCEVETLKAQVSELINQRNQLLKKETAWHDMARELKLALGNDGMLADNPLSALARDAALDRFDAMEKQP